MQKQEGFTVSAISLGLTASALYQCFVQSGTALSARAFLLLGLPGAAALVLISAAVAAWGQGSRLVKGDGPAARGVAAFFFLWFGAELLRTIGQAQGVCRQQFSSGALLGVLPLLLIFSWGLGQPACNRTARMLWRLMGIGLVIGLIGLGGQMHWQRLSQQPLQGQAPAVFLYPEYFALPLLTDFSRKKRAALLPGWVFGVQAAFAFGVELIFGAQRHADYTGFEALRVWGVGIFSRLDALLLLLWLAAVLYRICFLFVVLRMLWGRAFRRQPTAEQPGGLKEDGAC